MRLILTYCTGKMQVTDLMQLNLNFMKDPAYDPTFDIIMDFRDSTAFGFKFEMMEYLDFFRNTVRLKQKVRSGILLSTPNQKFLMTLYKPVARMNNIDVEDFQEIEKCLDWMSYSTDEQRIIFEAIDGMRKSLAKSGE